MIFSLRLWRILIREKISDNLSICGKFMSSFPKVVKIEPLVGILPNLVGQFINILF